MYFETVPWLTYDAQLEQLAVDARRAPQWIGQRHLANQIPYLSWRLRATRPTNPALPSPVVSEASAMPSDHGLGLDDVEGFAPIGPKAAQDVPERAITPFQ